MRVNEDVTSQTNVDMRLERNLSYHYGARGSQFLVSTETKIRGINLKVNDEGWPGGGGTGIERGLHLPIISIQIHAFCARDYRSY